MEKILLNYTSTRTQYLSILTKNGDLNVKFNQNYTFSLHPYCSLCFVFNLRDTRGCYIFSFYFQFSI